VVGLVVGTAAACGGAAAEGAASDAAAKPASQPTTTPDAFELSGRGQPLRLTVPPAGTAKPYPLVVALHSLFHDSSEARNEWGLDELAADKGFAVAYPDGLGDSWNAGTCCESSAADNIDDVGWLRSLIAHIGANYPVDLRRVYLVGFSNGGMLAYRYACEHGDEIAGIGVVAASLQVADCEPPAPTTVVSVHGLADMHVPLGGTEWSQSLRTRIRSARETFAPFRAADRCLEPDQPGDAAFTNADGLPLIATIPVAGQVGGAASRDHGSATRPEQGPAAPALVKPPWVEPPVAIRYEADCARDATVVEYQLPQLSHGWPPRSGPGAFDTVGAIWRILAASRSAAATPRF
jgi:poly(3-hydroxybutyrate) depolymerase